MEAVQGACAVRPVLCERLALDAVQFVSRPTGVLGAHFESGRVDEAVEFVLDAVHHHTFLGDELHSLPIGVDEMHVRTIEGVEIFVVETRALAELAVPRLQRRCGRRIGDQLINARADLLHLFEIGQLHVARQRLGRQIDFLL